MEYFLSIAGECSRPCTQFQLIERIREGSLQGTELAWHKGAPEWRPLKSLEEFASYWPLTAEQIAQADEARRIARVALDTPQPWLRFWARMVDYVWFSIALQTMLGAVLPLEKALLDMSTEAMILGMLVGSLTLLLFVPVEAWCLSRHGTTPGKSLLRIQVRQQDGSLPTFRQAMKRALLVYVRGVAFGLRLPALFTMSVSRMTLLRTGSTSWDSECHTRVEHGEPEVWRFLLLAAMVFAMVVAMIVIAVLMSHGGIEALHPPLPK